MAIYDNDAVYNLSFECPVTKPVTESNREEEQIEDIRVKQKPRGRERVNVGIPRTIFHIHPKSEACIAIENICEQCELTADTVISAMIDYALKHVVLSKRMICGLSFKD